MTRVQLGEFCDIAWGETSITKASYVPRGFPAFSASGQDGFLPTYAVAGTGIVLSAIGARCGKCFLARGKWTAIKNTIVIRPRDETQVDPEYLHLYLNQEAIWPTAGLAQPFITMRGAGTVLVPLPSLAKQRRAAATLKDELVDAGRVSRSLGHIGGALKDLEARLIGETFEELRSAPRITLGELTESTRPIQYGVLKPGPYVEGGVPLVRVVDFSDNVLDTTKLYRIGPELNDEFSRSKLRGGELLVSVQGTIGRAARVPMSLAGANISRTVAVVALDARANPDFVRLWLLHLGNRDEFVTVGSTRASLNIGELRKMEPPLPPRYQQDQIVQRLAERLDHVASMRAAVDLAAGLVAALPGAVLRRTFRAADA